jgi:hypothetical protein
LDLTKKAEAWHWDMAQEQAFTDLKTHMCKAPVLTQPDFNHKFYIQTDASGYGMGAILSQEGGSDTTALEQWEKTSLTPNCVLFSHFYPNTMEL